MATIPHAPGIYQITCTPTGRIYIGSAVNLARRQREHWQTLRGRRHTNVRLQRAWNKYGPDAFTFTVVELVAAEGLIEAEQRWIDATGAADHGFNICRDARSALGIKRRPETRQALSETKAHAWAGFVNPQGQPVTITNLWQFCKDNRLSFGAMHALATGSGRLRSYKGWTHINSPFVKPAFRRMARGRHGPYSQQGLFGGDDE